MAGNVRAGAAVKTGSKAWDTVGGVAAGGGWGKGSSQGRASHFIEPELKLGHWLGLELGPGKGPKTKLELYY